MSGIIWLASYPKSGNTWFSLFLANLLADAAVPIDINHPFRPAHFAAREHFDRLTGWESSELTAEQQLRLRLPAQEALAGERMAVFNKTHEAFADPCDGTVRFSRRATKCVLLLVRNPLDIVASLSHHSGLSLDETIRFMNDPRAANILGGNLPQLPQLLLDWSSHTASWLDATGLAVLPIRYEDLLVQPEENFFRACRFAGLPLLHSRVVRAVENSRFGVLQRQEEARGFNEAPRGRKFFREGRSGSWRHVLSECQVAQIAECHAPMMRRFGYWNDGGPIAELSEHITHSAE